MTTQTAPAGTLSEVPGQVYLCQINQRVSCGACCGLYNVADASAQSLHALLAKRTREFAAVRRTDDGIYQFQRSIERSENQKRPYPDFHHCAFIGLIGSNHSRVGCLLHPEADGNDGVDFRGLSWYGGLACRSYFCPTYRQLPARIKIAVREAAPDWFLWGLIITEVGMLACLFNEIEHRLKRQVRAGDFLTHTNWRLALLRFFELKTDWPFRSCSAPGPGNYFFEDGQYPCPPVHYPGSCAGRSPFNDIFRALRSSFDSRASLEAAETLIESILRPFSRQP